MSAVGLFSIGWFGSCWGGGEDGTGGRGGRRGRKEKPEQTEDDDNHDPMLFGIGSLDQEWINMSQVGEWTDFCNENHQGTCHTVTDPWGTFPFPERLATMSTPCEP